MDKINEIISEMYHDIGIKQGSKRHHQIINDYNQIVPLPSGYKVKYSDSWCMTYVSYLLHKHGIECDYECSVERFTKKNKKFIVDKCKKGDIICYDWHGDNWLDHVGIIVDIIHNDENNLMLKVIEGNYNKQVDIRYIMSNSKSIKCFISIENMINNVSIKKSKKTK